MAPGRATPVPAPAKLHPPPPHLPPPPHFILFPLMAQGHTIPIIDMARLISDRGAFVTIVTTPHNSTRFESVIRRANSSAHRARPEIRIVRLYFPCQEVGLPLGYENLDVLPSPDLLKKFYEALDLLQGPLESVLRETDPPPSCLISDRCLSWTAEMARRLNITRIVFHGMSCFSLLSAVKIRAHKAHLSAASDEEPFLVPGMPQPYYVSRSQLPGSFLRLPDLDDVRNKMQEAETQSFGVVANTFEFLEHGCAEEYRNSVRKRVWCVGPVSLTNRFNLDKFERGNNNPSIDEAQCLTWLDRMEPRSVIYACLGSLCRLVPSQLLELGLGLEASGRPFVWAVKTDRRPAELDDWLVGSGFEDRVKGRGLIIKGWAPQVLILSHVAVGGFLTHCGWNSTVEAICAGVPMVTWPLFAEQFLNEKMVVEVLRVGVRVGAETAVRFGDEERVGVAVRREAVAAAVEALMDGGGERMVERVRELAAMAREAMDPGGSSHSDLSDLIEAVVKRQAGSRAKN
ncbi:unnamed protein product [Linum trigynum]|uniref:Glycosyltransferase n=2 Tax=Linum trigynum TaxID=586398 RepID=A0AAV2DIV5_9ROSI